MDVVYTETAMGQLWVEGGDGAAQHDRLFQRLVASALSPADSETFINALHKEM